MEGSMELIDVLSAKALSMGVRLSLLNVTNLAIEHYNLRWDIISVYLKA